MTAHPKGPARLDVGFLDRVQARRAREPFRSVDELHLAPSKVARLRRRVRGTGKCPACGGSMPTSSGAAVCGRSHR